jgi:hypothetical protein
MKRKSMNLVKMLSLMAVLAFIAPLMMQARGDKVNFSGTWTLNKMESSPAALSSSSEMIVKHEGNSFITTTTDKDGMAVVTKYTLDGKESVNKFGSIKSKSTAKLSSDGKALTILSVTYENDEEKTDQDVWTLIDSHTLSVVCTIMGSSGDEETRFVYTKK